MACIAGLAGCETAWHRAGPVPVSVARGKDIYQENCSGCHAIRATGDSFRAVPALAGQRFEYLRRQIDRFASDERHSAAMRWAFNRVSMSTPQAAIDVATYLSQLPEQKFAEGDPLHQTEGKTGFVAHCAACHGMDARGNVDGTTPSLRAQHDSYLVNRLRQFASTSMTVGDHNLDERAIIAISAYLSSMQGVDATE